MSHMVEQEVYFNIDVNHRSWNHETKEEKGEDDWDTQTERAREFAKGHDTLPGIARWRTGRLQFYIYSYYKLPLINI